MKKEIKGKCFNAAGKTTIRELACLYKQVDLFIGGDTGPMHLAAAVNTPVIALMGPTDPRTHGPYGDNNIVIQKDLDCINCWERECSRDHACMQKIQVEEVLEAVKKLI